ncbi:MAG: cytochrome c4 [Methylobacillus sp.]|jgi:cytochrome c553|nr:cytochrome c4 [Methylobacillus sp.]
MSFRVLAVLLAGLMSATIAQAAGDPAKGKVFADSVCMACHAADGNSVITANPKLAGQHPEYLLKQLKDFKAGTRNNPIMAGMVAVLPTEADMADAAAYFASQKPAPGAAATNGAGSLGEKLFRAGVPLKGVPACAGCHGATGLGVPAQFPRLAGQHVEYTVAQMKIFRTGERGNAPMMRVIASRMSDDEIAAVADYIQGLK